MKMRSVLGVPLAMAALSFSSMAAADSLNYLLGLGNSGGLGTVAGPYATAEVDLLSSTSAKISFDSLSQGGYTFIMAGAGAFAINVNAASWSLGSISASNSLGS